jgi:hypothetical protein
MPTDSTAPISDAFMVLLHHVIFEMTPEQAAALMADDTCSSVGDNQHNTNGALDTSGAEGQLQTPGERCNLPTHSYTAET